MNRREIGLEWIKSKMPDFFLNQIKKYFVRDHLNQATQSQINQLNKQLNSMLAWLRSKKTAEGVCFNQLPCTLIIGARDAGKTSLLMQSEIPFVLRKKPEQLPLETQIPSWFVSIKQIWLDLPGHWFLPIKKGTDSESPSLEVIWKTFAFQLWRKKQKEVSAGLICIPLAKRIFSSSSKKQIIFWKSLAKRIQIFQTQFPQAICHLILTKSDCIPGFTSFFSELSLEESQQPYGIHLSSGVPLEKQIQSIDQLYSSLLQRIKNQMLLRLHRENDPLEKIKLLQFPSALEQFKTHLLDGLKEMAKQAPSLSLGGVYWTSAMSEPEGEAFEESAQSPQLPTITLRAQLARPYFIHHLMQSIKKIKMPNPKWISYFPYLSYGGMGVIIWLTGAMIFDFFSAHRLMSQLVSINTQYQKNISMPFNAEKNLVVDAKYFQDLKHLTAHRYSFWRYFSNQTEKVINKNQKQFLNQQLLISWQHYLGDQLLHAKPNSKEIYSQLQAYLMLAGALPKDSHALQNVFLSHQADFEKLGITPDYFQLCLSHLIKSEGQQLPLDANIVAQARQLLWNKPVLDLAMLILENQSQSENQPSLSLIQSTQPLIFYTKQATDIQPLFTVNAIQTVLSSKLNNALQVAIHGNAVLGMPLNSRSVDEKSELALLQQQYLKNYVFTWESALFRLHLSEPSDLREADNMITLMISDRSPLLSLLRLVHAHTYFSPMSDMSPTLQSLGGLWLGQAHSDLLLNIFSKLKNVHDYLQPILTAENPNKAAYIALAQRKPEDKPDVLTALYLVSEDCPEPLKQWLRRLANHTWKQLLASSNTYLNTAMNENKKSNQSLAQVSEKKIVS